MFRQMDLREAVLSRALKRSLLYDSQRKMKFLDIVEVIPEPPEEPDRTARQARRRSKSSKKTDRKVWEEEPEPVDPYTELLALGQQSVAVCKEAFFQQNAKNRIKPFSGPWHSVQPQELVAKLIAVMNPELPKEATELENEMLHSPELEFVEDSEKLEAEESIEDSPIDSRLNEAMLYFNETSNPSIGNDEPLGMLSKLMVPKVDTTGQKPQEQAPDADKSKKSKKKPKKRNRIRARNKGYVPDKDNTLGCPEEASAVSASRKTTNLDAEDAAKTLDTGASIESQANPYSVDAEELLRRLSFSSTVDVDVDSNEKPNNLEAKDEIVVVAAGTDRLITE